MVLGLRIIIFGFDDEEVFIFFFIARREFIGFVVKDGGKGMDFEIR